MADENETRTPFRLSIKRGQTWLSLPAIKALGLIAFIFLAGWKCQSWFDSLTSGQRAVVDELRAIRATTQQSWTTRDMVDYGTSLRDLNAMVARSDGTGLRTPDARSIHSLNAAEASHTP